MYSSSNYIEYKWWQIMWNRKSFKNAYSWKRQFLAAREVPGSNRAADKKILSFTKITAIRSFGHGLHFDGSAYRSTQFSTIRGMANEYQPYGWVIIQMAMGECSVYRPIAANRRTRRSSLHHGLLVGGHLALTDFRPDYPKWILAHGRRRIDSTINIVLGIPIHP